MMTYKSSKVDRVSWFSGAIRIH